MIFFKCMLYVPLLVLELRNKSPKEILGDIKEHIRLRFRRRHSKEGE